MLDFWLGKWSGKADAWNMTERSHWEAYETHLRQKSLPGERAKPVDPLVLSVSDRYTAFVEETVRREGEEGEREGRKEGRGIGVRSIREIERGMMEEK